MQSIKASPAGRSASTAETDHKWQAERGEEEDQRVCGWMNYWDD